MDSKHLHPENNCTKELCTQAGIADRRHRRRTARLFAWVGFIVFVLAFESSQGVKHDGIGLDTLILGAIEGVCVAVFYYKITGTSWPVRSSWREAAQENQAVLLDIPKD